MKLKCHECDGYGRLRNEPFFCGAGLAFGIATFGMAWLIRSIVERHADDDEFWHDCPYCNGYGWFEV